MEERWIEIQMQLLAYGYRRPNTQCVSVAYLLIKPLIVPWSYFLHHLSNKGK